MAATRLVVTLWVPPSQRKVNRTRWRNGAPRYNRQSTARSVKGKKGGDMRRTILLARVPPFISAFLGGILELGLVIPRAAEAQRTLIQAQWYEVVRDDGQ